MSTTVRDNPDELRPFCPYVKAYIAKHPEYVDLVPEGQRSRFGLSGS